MELHHFSQIKTPYRRIHALLGISYLCFTNFPSDNLNSEYYAQMRKNIMFCQSQIVFE